VIVNLSIEELVSLHHYLLNIFEKGLSENLDTNLIHAKPSFKTSFLRARKFLRRM